mmetsp:Transcript_22310/g.51570  ORF Transcript_22310/g.51570 Transcript_22310/m.51570 type:complete len:311 (+) Transcript_22310:251-1183(+)
MPKADGSPSVAGSARRAYRAPPPPTAWTLLTPARPRPASRPSVLLLTMGSAAPMTSPVSEKPFGPSAPFAPLAALSPPPATRRILSGGPRIGDGLRTRPGAPAPRPRLPLRRSGEPMGEVPLSMVMVPPALPGPDIACASPPPTFPRYLTPSLEMGLLEEEPGRRAGLELLPGRLPPRLLFRFGVNGPPTSFSSRSRATASIAAWVCGEALIEDCTRSRNDPLVCPLGSLTFPLPAPDEVGLTEGSRPLLPPPAPPPPAPSPPTPPPPAAAASPAVPFCSCHLSLSHSWFVSATSMPCSLSTTLSVLASM